MSDEPLWLKSPVDEAVHGWPTGQKSGEVWKAICPATAAGDYLTVDEKGTKCVLCLIEHGNTVADRQDAQLSNRRQDQQAQVRADTERWSDEAD